MSEKRPLEAMEEMVHKLPPTTYQNKYWPNSSPLSFLFILCIHASKSVDIHNSSPLWNYNKNKKNPTIVFNTYDFASTEQTEINKPTEPVHQVQRKRLTFPRQIELLFSPWNKSLTLTHVLPKNTACHFNITLRSEKSSERSRQQTIEGSRGSISSNGRKTFP